MSEHKTNKLYSLKNLVSSTVLFTVFAAVLAAFSTLVFAQTAEVKRVGVYYKDSPNNLAGMYCDVLNTTTTGNTNPGGNGNDDGNGTNNPTPTPKTSTTATTDLWEDVKNIGNSTYTDGDIVWIFPFDDGTLKYWSSDTANVSSSEDVEYGNLAQHVTDGHEGRFRCYVDGVNEQLLKGTLIRVPNSPEYEVLDHAFFYEYPDPKEGYEDHASAQDSIPCKIAEVQRVITPRTLNAPLRAGGSSITYSVNPQDERSFVTVPTPYGNQVQPDQGYLDGTYYATQEDVTTGTNPITPSTAAAGDPWVSSALIEYDQPYPNDIPKDNYYPNHCLGLCMEVYCNNLPQGQSTYSISFPLQQVRFEILKYYNNQNLYNAEAATPVRTIDLFPGTPNTGGTADLGRYMCGSYKCSNAGKSKKESGVETEWGECVGFEYVCDNATVSSRKCWPKNMTRADADKAGQLTNYGNGTCGDKYEGVGHSNCVIFNDDGAASFTPITFCAAWDANYEHSGEMGKSNGQFAFRGRVATNTPGDGIITQGNIEFDSMMVYPAMNQIPIQVDVTNVHTVRSTPSLVGKITPVAAQPYTLVYRLSKDADVRIAIFDAETRDDAMYAWTEAYETTNTTNTVTGAPSAANTAPVRLLVDWQPRNGEGMIGDTTDKILQDFDSWDGRNDSGMLLPAGNYVATIQAKSRDEWPGIDFSRAVTRQISLDPLKLTDVQVMGLTKKSTAYATISYVPTESSNVYWEIYTPGTVFKGDKGNAIDTDSSTPTGTAPSVVEDALGTPTGSLVYRSQENRSGRMNYTSRWDGTCQIGVQQRTLPNGQIYPSYAYTNANVNTHFGENEKCNATNGCTYYTNGCIRTYAKNEQMSDGTTCNPGTENVCTKVFPYGAPMPDGNYVYVLWAEVPYNGAYTNLAYGRVEFIPSGTCNSGYNNRCFTGVKTLKYKVGTLEVERGLVGITIQPVSYSTIGSSPTAYGLDPFIFKYALERDANAVASVQNTAGVVVRYLTPKQGTANVSQQMNTLSWDGRDEQGRMVTPGTYWFVVEAHDAMFPSVKNRASAVFPVDMYRVTDVATTDVYGDSNAKATISYLLSKAMNVQINIYNKDVVIPAYNSTTGDYNGTPKPIAGHAVVDGNEAMNMDIELSDGDTVSIDVPRREDVRHGLVETTGTIESDLGDECVYTFTIVNNVQLRIDIVKMKNGARTSSRAWPPRVCNTDTDASIFTEGYVDPAKVAARTDGRTCIYVNDTTFTDYPSSLADAADITKVDVRLQPIKTFDRSATKNGDGMLVMEEWDALYFYNPNPSVTEHTAAEIAKCKNAKNPMDCPYETVPDGSYPFFISARSDEPFSRYYYDELMDGTMTGYTTSGDPFKTVTDVKQQSFLYATEKPVSKLNVTRGPVYFLDGSVAVYPNAPQVFNASTGPTFIPPYEINFAVSRAAEVEIAIVALKDNVCSPAYSVAQGGVNATDGNANNLYPNSGTDPDVADDDSTQSAATNANGRQLKNNRAGDICKFLSTMTIANTGDFDANIIRKTYWDGTDHTGQYVKPGIYEVRLTARNYPNNGAYQPTVKSIPVNANLFKVFDLLDADSYSIAVRNTDMHVGYQISVPMKVAIQIFKPGTTIYDYSKGTLRNPTTGKEVQDIREVLVRSIVGIRPSMTLIDEIWDGRDYAQQEVPDGTYPFRFVTAINSADVDSMTGEIIPGSDMGKANSNNAKVNTSTASDWKVNYVADTYEYQNLHKATVAIGDGKFVCEDWEKTVIFYPNPLRDASKGTLEVTKMPVPGTMSIKYFNLAGDLVRDSGYTCVDANNYQVTMDHSLTFNPDNDPVGSSVLPETTTDGTPSLANNPNVRNAAMRCKWDATNQSGKKVAHGVYFGLVDFKAKAGREHCQKVVKIIVP